MLVLLISLTNLTFQSINIQVREYYLNDFVF